MSTNDKIKSISNNNIPPAIRVLPMDSVREFPDWSIEKVQQEFFSSRITIT